MAYTGFISDPSYTRSDREETIEKPWHFSETIDGVALKAKWGDLAEVYACDPHEVLIPGTVVKFGGKYEITKTGSNAREFFGVISTNPGIVLNKKEEHGEKVALVGRVPVRVVGEIHRFDKITTSKYAGIAKRKTWLDTLLLKPTIGVSLKTDTNENEKLVEVFVKSHR